MTPGRLSKLDHIHDKLFLEDSGDLTPFEQKLVLRYNAAFTVWLGNPTLTERQIATYLVKNYDISRTQALQDVKNIKYMLGNVNNAAKEWQRYKVIYMIDEAYKIAKIQKDAKAMAALIDKLGKYTNLDKEDPREKPWDEILPQPFEPTSDPTVIGIKPVPNLREKMERMKKKYFEMIDIEDATHEPAGSGE